MTNLKRMIQVNNNKFGDIDLIKYENNKNEEIFNWRKQGNTIKIEKRF